MATEARHTLHLARVGLQGRRSERTVRPLGCFYWGSVWTLAAWCESRHGFRSFRVDRIAELRVGDERFRDEAGKTLADLFRRVEAQAGAEAGAEVRTATAANAGPGPNGAAGRPRSAGLRRSEHRGG